MSGLHPCGSHQRLGKPFSLLSVTIFKLNNYLNLPMIQETFGYLQKNEFYDRMYEHIDRHVETYTQAPGIKKIVSHK